MRLDHAEDLASFVDELRKETDRGLSLVGAALIDDKLQETIQSFCVENRSVRRLLTDGNAPLGTFSSRIEVCYALGLIDEFEYQEIGLIRKVRNEFAHAKHGTNFQSSKIIGLCSSLKSDLPEGANYSVSDPRFRFTNAVVSLVLRLYYRPDYVEKERRQPKMWVKDMQWTSVDDEKPPEGVPVIVMAKPKTE